MNQVTDDIEKRPVPDPAAIRQDLEHMTARWAELPEPCLFELRALKEGAKPDTMKFSPSWMDEAVDWVMNLNNLGFNLYAVRNPIKSTASGSAKDSDILAALCLWADCDDPASAGNVYRFDGPKWTAAVTTGRTPSVRVHTYWQLAEPCFDLGAWRAMQEAIAAHFGSDRTVTNPSRIMRIGGTVSYPPMRKQEKGYIRETCTIRTEYPEPRPPVTLDEMRAALGIAKAPTLPASTTLLSTQATAAIPLGLDLGSHDRADTSTAEVAEILTYIPASSSYADWLAVLMGLHDHYNGSHEGLAVAEEWSATCPDKFVAGEVGRKWRGFTIGGGTGWPTVCALARQNGADLAAIARRRRVETAVQDVQSPIDGAWVAGSSTASGEWLQCELARIAALPQVEWTPALKALHTECHARDYGQDLRDLKRWTKGMATTTAPAVTRRTVEIDPNDHTRTAQTFLSQHYVVTDAYTQRAVYSLCVHQSVFYRWTGPHWEPTAMGGAGLLGEVAKEVYRWLATDCFWVDEDDNQLDLKPSSKLLTEVLLAMQTLLAVNSPGWQVAPPCRRALPCANGILDLDSLTLYPQTPSYFATVSVRANWNPRALSLTTIPEWAKFLSECFVDSDQITMWQEWLGYLLTDETCAQKGAMLVGKRRSGKGTWGRIISELLGTVAEFKTRTFERDSGLANFVDKTVAVNADMRVDRHTNLEANEFKFTLSAHHHELARTASLRQDPVGEFIRQELTVTGYQGDKVLNEDLHTVFLDFAHRAGVTHFSEQAFGKRLWRNEEILAKAKPARLEVGGVRKRAVAGVALRRPRTLAEMVVLRDTYSDLDFLDETRSFVSKRGFDGQSGRTSLAAPTKFC